MTIVSKLLHSVILKIREKAATDRDEALSHARVLDELFELDLAEHIAELVRTRSPAMPATKARGRVWLVGAGPGDPGLLTLRAAQVLASADVLLYDALAGETIVDGVPPRCTRIFVGKRGSNHAMPQADIETLMIREASAGKHVVRLKGGDPFVFGRGAEEAQALRAAGIDFAIVPGISSAIAAPAYAGIPLTHRAHNAAFTVATGHEDPTKAASTLDWGKLADPHRTLVFLMASTPARGHRRATRRSRPARRHAGGRGAERHAPDQRTVAGTLATIAADAAREGVGAPAVLVIGDVVRVRDEIALVRRGAAVWQTRARNAPRPVKPKSLRRTYSATAPSRSSAPVLKIEPPADPDAAARAIDELARLRLARSSRRATASTRSSTISHRGARMRAISAASKLPPSARRRRRASNASAFAPT